MGGGCIPSHAKRGKLKHKLMFPFKQHYEFQFKFGWGVGGGGGAHLAGLYADTWDGKFWESQSEAHQYLLTFGSGLSMSPNWIFSCFSFSASLLLCFLNFFLSLLIRMKGRVTAFDGSPGGWTGTGCSIRLEMSRYLSPNAASLEKMIGVSPKKSE